MARCEPRHSSWRGGSGRPARSSSDRWAASSQACRSPRPRSMSLQVGVRYRVSKTESRGRPCVRSSSRATSQRMSQSTPPKSKMTPRRLVLALGLSRRGRIGGLHRRADVCAEGDPSAVLHAALVEDLRLRVGAGDAVALEISPGVVGVGLVPLLVGRALRATTGDDEESDGEQRNQCLHWGAWYHAAKMLDTTIAGSLPKPAWLATPRMLWAPWKIEGAALEEGKRDAVRLALQDQAEAGIDIVTDGEQTRRHFVWGFVEQLE